MMNRIFEKALSIDEPWYIKDIEFDPDKKRLDIYVDFKRGSTFKVNEPGHDGMFVDLAQRRTIFVVEGKGHETVKAFADDLKTHNGSPDQISDVSLTCRRHS